MNAKMKIALPAIFCMVFLTHTAETCAYYSLRGKTCLNLPQVSDDAQQQFFSGLHSVFSTVELLDRLGWNSPNFLINRTIIFIIIAIIPALFFYWLNNVIRRKRERAGSVETMFTEYSIRFKLTEEESDFLKAIAVKRDMPQPYVIFQSLQAFERCVDFHIKEFMKKNPGREELDITSKMLVDIRNKLGFQHIPLEYPLASTRNIAIGQAGSLFNKEGNAPIFRNVSVMENSPFYLTLKYEVDKEEVRKLTAGQIVRFAFARQTDGLYGIQVPVAKTDGAGQIDLFHTVEMKRNQLRQYVRIETSLPLKFRLIQTHDPERSEIKRGELIATRLSDISGGGLSFVYERSLRLGDVISLNFDLPGSPFAGIAGKIVHLSLREAKTARLFKHHVQFLNIEPRKREKIISYVFEKERQMNQWR